MRETHSIRMLFIDCFTCFLFCSVVFAFCLLLKRRWVCVQQNVANRVPCMALWYRLNISNDIDKRCCVLLVLPHLIEIYVQIFFATLQPILFLVSLSFSLYVGMFEHFVLGYTFACRWSASH